MHESFNVTEFGLTLDQIKEQKGLNARYIIKAIKNKPLRRNGSNGRQAQVGDGEYLIVDGMIKFFLAALEKLDQGINAFDDGAYLTTNLAELNAWCKRGSKRAISDALRDRQFGKVFESYVSRRNCLGWAIEIKVRFRTDLLLEIINNYRGNPLQANDGKEPTTLSLVQSDVAAAPSVPVKDKEKTPVRVVVPFLKKKIQSYQDLNTEAREVFNTLQGYFMEKIEDIPGKTFALIQRYVNDFAPCRKMTLTMMEDVLRKLSNYGDMFEERQRTNDLEHFVRYWPSYIRVVKLSQVQIANTDGPAIKNELTHFTQLRELYKSMNYQQAVDYMMQNRHGASLVLDLLAFGSTRSVSKSLLTSFARRGKDYLLQRPVVYQGVYRLIGTLPDLIGISDEQHLELVKVAKAAILRAELTMALEHHYTPA